MSQWNDHNIKQSTRTHILALALDTWSFDHVIPLFADLAGVVLPIKAVFELALSIDKLVLALTLAAQLSVVGCAPFNWAGTALQFVMSNALNTNVSVVFQTSLLHLFAWTWWRQIVAAFASNTPIVVIGLATCNCAVIVAELEGLQTGNAIVLLTL